MAARQCGRLARAVLHVTSYGNLSTTSRDYMTARVAEKIHIFLPTHYLPTIYSNTPVTCTPNLNLWTYMRLNLFLKNLNRQICFN